MRGLIVGLPLSLALWGLAYLFIEYGWLAFAILMIAGGFSYIAWTIWRDWKPITQGEWQDGEPVNYGKSDAPR